MDTQIPEDIVEIKTDTERIHALTQTISQQPACNCKDNIIELQKELKALEEKVSIKEEECLQQRERFEFKRNARTKQFEEITAMICEIERSITTIKNNKHVCARDDNEKAHNLTSSSHGASELGRVSKIPLQIQHTNTIARVKRQLERRNSMDLEKWHLLAQQEAEKVASVTRPLDSYHTVLLLDISESMTTGDLWKHANTFVNDFLSGVEEHASLIEPFRHFNEHVGLVTFGHRTQIEVPLTKDFKVIRNSIGKFTIDTILYGFPNHNIELGGPSPLVGGLLVASAMLQSAQFYPGLINNVSMHHKIIVITDGQPTEMSLSSGPDLVNDSLVDEERANLLCTLDAYNDAKISIFFIEIPYHESTFFGCIRSYDPYRNVFAFNDGRRLARRNYLCTKTVDWRSDQ
ncbi:hypothetical protein DPMN_109471 [Dreissena polymorpha]|uniref:VWFA domain-containing protein n=1 Tax=Dreissena polymorpha TaxID=45954 RepID=A0A9D4QMZ0_DREPO|nr:hypothetical protein DPMN_109471 [Dreissena polymorpha]